jgi:exonuclease VII small subunit
MKDEFPQILDTCLTEIQRGRLTLDQALAAYPEYGDQLRALLDLAQETRAEFAPDDPDPTFLRASHARVVAKVSSKSRTTAPGRRFSFRPAYVALVLTLAAVLFGSGFGVFSASAASLPGDPLYGVKRAGEELQLALTFSPAGDKDLLLDFAQKRLDELQALIDEGRYDDLDRALAEFDRQMERIGAQTPDPAREAKYEHLQEQLAKHIQTLERVRDQVPENAQPSIEKALERSRHSQAVLDILEEGGSPSDLAPGQLKKDEHQDLEQDKGPKGPNGNGHGPDKEKVK